MHTIYYKVLKTFTTLQNDTIIEIPSGTIMEKEINEGSSGDDYSFIMEGETFYLNSYIIEHNPAYFEYDHEMSEYDPREKIEEEMEMEYIKDQFLEIYDDLCSIIEPSWASELVKSWMDVENELENPKNDLDNSEPEHEIHFVSSGTIPFTNIKYKITN